MHMTHAGTAGKSPRTCEHEAVDDVYEGACVRPGSMCVCIAVSIYLYSRCILKSSSYFGTFPMVYGYDAML